MKRPAVKRGFKAVKEEEKRREKAREASKGKLWRVFFPKDADEDFEIPFTFLTEEPICFHEHTKNIRGKIVNVPCTGDDCEECADGDKPRFVGAFLGIDHTPFSYEEKKDGKSTGKKIKGDARLKLLVRGSTDLAKLDRLNNKYGLTDYRWAICKTGKDTSTTWNFDKEDENDLSKKEIQNIIPEQYRDMDFYDIVEQQVMGNESDEDETDDGDDGDDTDVQRGVQNLDDEDDEDNTSSRNKKSSKAGSKKPMKPRKR